MTQDERRTSAQKEADLYTSQPFPVSHVRPVAAHVPSVQTGIIMQAFTAWHGLIQQYSRQPLLPPTVCSIVEDMALALPDLAEGEAPWSPLDDDPEMEGEGTF